MPKFPKFLEPFHSAAETLFNKGYAHDIIFSRNTYQVEIRDPKIQQSVWSFIQLTPKGTIKDCFCSCEEEANVSSCVHIATAYLKIFNGHSLPLHERFRVSLWNQLGILFADTLGTSQELLKMDRPGHYRYHADSSSHLSFSIEALSKESRTQLAEITKPKQYETEETSMKFSNLPQEEITRWREGRPSPELRYELSFWNDIAKWLMLKQDSKEEYQIQFKESPHHLPISITVHFSDLKATFSFSEKELPFLIPSFATVHSPFKLHSNYEESIDKITYDQKGEGSLHIIPKPSFHTEFLPNKNQGKALSIDRWLFIPGDGFYPKEQHSLLETPILQGKAIAQALNTHLKEISHLIVGTSIHEDPFKISYTLSFDSDWNLHISAYLFQPEDLKGKTAHFYGDWAYLDGSFYHLEEVVFEEVEKIVPAQQVSEFVSKNRSWLNTQEKFHTHLTSLENQLIYTLDSKDRLIFDTQLDISEESLEHKDFGSWIYLIGQGFFSKGSPHLLTAIRPGTTVEPHALPLFVRMNQEELQLVPHFFNPKCPVIQGRLEIRLNEEERIHLAPHYELLPEYLNQPLKFFDDVVYVPKEGFHLLPQHVKLPEEFQHDIWIEKQDTDLFLRNEFDSVKKYASSIDPRLTEPKTLELVAESIEVTETLGHEWDMAKMFYQTESGKIPISAVWKAISKKRQFLFSEAGLLDLKEGRFNWLRKLRKDQIDLKRNLIKLSTMEILRLDAYDEIHTPPAEAPDYQHVRDLLKELRTFKTPEHPQLAGLNSHLRPYQETGVQWLWFLYYHRLSGLLCDEMGLGKTHQAMALFAAIINHKKSLPNPSTTPFHFLVVCPTSVIYHWQEKLEMFLPGLRVCTFHGINRSLGDFQKEYDVLLTSYGIWRNDNELLNKVPFEAAIFDEVQIAKNDNSQIYAALLNVQAKVRIGLTGTPIENRLRELKALFDVILPHYMPGESEYREFFIKPIEKLHDTPRKQLLSRFIKPFVLRRKKQDVLSDLPEKIEEIAHCELLPKQQELYQQTLLQSRERIISGLEDSKNPIPYMHIFALLSALKQICDHPAVFLKQPQDYKSYPSGKWDLFLELLHEARESQQKVVIFSQYLYMLDIIEDYLQEHRIGFAAIRGSTMNRGEQVKRFNQDPDCEVFVGSLNAAGLGIDLTAGSVVIHYDRWWNAARENQATDRVHRIGQKRGVQVFKLVTKGTFEERIDALITQKGKLMEDVIGVDEQQFIKQFDRQEIMQLLQDIEQKS